MRKFVFTSESVSSGHPDKIADQIADAILDEVITQDPKARSAIEVTTSTGDVTVFGELSTSAYVNIRQIVSDTIKKIGYDKPELGFSFDSVNISNKIVEQSKDIAQAVNQAEDDEKELGAGDQGMVFGYATNETENFLPLNLDLAHKLMKKLEQVRKSGDFNYLRPDAKAEVSIEYIEDDNHRVYPNAIHTVLISTQHDENVDLKQLKKDVIEQVVIPVLPEKLVNEQTRYLINPSGRFVIGGPQADSGLTGRKIIVDTYGGSAHHGGGAFSGKDGTKVDRSGAYMARYVAKNLVAAGVADQLEIQVSYAIGVASPISIYANTFGTNKIELEKIDRLIEKFDFRPSAIIKKLNLRQPIFFETSVYGHFGRDDKDFPWERLDAVEMIKENIRKA